MSAKQNNHQIYIGNNLLDIVVFMIPVTIMADWLHDFEILSIPLGLYLKGLSIALYIYIFSTNSIRGFYFKNVLLYILLLFVIYSLFSDNILLNLYFSIRVAYWIFASIVFYFLFQNKLISVPKFKIMLILSASIAAIFTIRYISGLDEENYANASGYLLLWILPLLLVFRKEIIVKLIILISIVAILITIKRGVMLALLLSFLGYMLALLFISRDFISKMKIFLGGILIAGVSLIVLIPNWEIVSNRFEDKSGSGRDNLYETIITSYANSDLIHQFFGYGINSVQKLTAIVLAGHQDSVGVAAHSDWLQYLYDFGVLGLFFMIVMHYKMLSFIAFYFRARSNLFPSLLMFYMIFFLTTVYSFILNTPNAIFLGIGLAFFSAYKNHLGAKMKTIG